MSDTRDHFSIYHQLTLLSEPTRVRILRILEQAEVSVGELTRIIQLPQSTVSRQIKALQLGGWVARRTVGTTSLLHMVEEAQRPPQSSTLWPTLRDNPNEQPEREQDTARLHIALAARNVDSKAFFGRVASSWDVLRRDMFGEHFELPTFLALLPSDWTIADLGCGTGKTISTLAPHVAHVIGIDREKAMLEAARRRNATLPNVELRNGDLYNLPLQNAEAHAALCLLVLHHIESPQSVFAEAARGLCSGGKFVVLDMVPHKREDYRREMGHHHLGFSPQDMEHIAAPTSLSLQSYQPLLADPDSKGPGLFVATFAKKDR